MLGLCLCRKSLARSSGHRLARLARAWLALARGQCAALHPAPVGKSPLGLPDGVLSPARLSNCVPVDSPVPSPPLVLCGYPGPLPHEHLLDCEWFLLLAFDRASSAVFPRQGPGARVEDLVAAVALRWRHQRLSLFSWLCAACDASECPGSPEASIAGGSFCSRLSGHPFFRHGAECIRVGSGS